MRKERILWRLTLGPMKGNGGQPQGCTPKCRARSVAWMGFPGARERVVLDALFANRGLPRQSTFMYPMERPGAQEDT